jgi:uncharacterized protein YbdZ (MbtH family)
MINLIKKFKMRKKMTQAEELKIRLEQHKMWLMDQPTGARFVAKVGENLQSADLQYANLQYADLRYANLQSADLRSADLRSADLQYANLRYANLQYADLRYANLQYADLRYADLRSADLQYANLRYANLQYANLRYANLQYADLRYANLRSADLKSANGFKFTPLQVVNTKFFITILDDHVLWGCRKFTFEEVKALELKDCQETWNESEFKLNKKIITEMIRYYRA